MPELFLDQHRQYCNYEHCKDAHEYFLCFIINDFFLIKHYGCHCLYGNRYEFYQQVIEQVIKKKFKLESVSVSRDNISRDRYVEDNKGYYINRRLEGLYKKKEIMQFCYKYDSYGRDYAIISKMKYAAKYYNNEVATANYNTMKVFLSENERLSFFLPQLDMLYKDNLIVVDDNEMKIKLDKKKYKESYSNIKEIFDKKINRLKDKYKALMDKLCAEYVEEYRKIKDGEAITNSTGQKYLLNNASIYQYDLKTTFGKYEPRINYYGNHILPSGNVSKRPYQQEQPIYGKVIKADGSTIELSEKEETKRKVKFRNSYAKLKNKYKELSNKLNKSKEKAFNKLNREYLKNSGKFNKGDIVEGRDEKYIVAEAEVSISEYLRDEDEVKIYYWGFRILRSGIASKKRDMILEDYYEKFIE